MSIKYIEKICKIVLFHRAMKQRSTSASHMFLFKTKIMSLPAVLQWPVYTDNKFERFYQIPPGLQV